MEKWKAGRYQVVLWTVLVLGLLAGLIFLGKALTPEGGKVLTWPEWQILLADRAYEKELSLLRQDAEILAGLVNQSPDPVRAQVICTKISAQTLEGETALAIPRDAISTAADAVQQWAVGAITRDEALSSLDTAIQSIQQLSPQTGVSP
jgi:hypothetical protein